MPSRRARSSRSGVISQIVGTAPDARATSAVSRPIGPAPVTSTWSPAPAAALRQAHTATLSGSTSAAASAGIDAGTG
jgi:hypothetical protein